MIYTKNFKNKKYDQYSYHTLGEKIQYKQKYLQHIRINGNQWVVLSFIDSHASHYKMDIFDSNKSNKNLDHETIKKNPKFSPILLINLYLCCCNNMIHILVDFFVIIYLVDITSNIQPKTLKYITAFMKTHTKNLFVKSFFGTISKIELILIMYKKIHVHKMHLNNPTLDNCQYSYKRK
jgi:hypothetical protein